MCLAMRRRAVRREQFSARMTRSTASSADIHLSACADPSFFFFKVRNSEGSQERVRAREPNITTPHDRVVKSAQGTSGRIHRQFNVDEREKVAIVVKGHRPEAL